jgi:hypothetical protein
MIIAPLRMIRSDGVTVVGQFSQQAPQPLHLSMST